MIYLSAVFAFFITLCMVPAATSYSVAAYHYFILKSTRMCHLFMAGTILLCVAIALALVWFILGLAFIFLTI